MKKFLLLIAFLPIPTYAFADVFVLNNGTRIEGEVMGELDGDLLIKTAHETLNIKKTDIIQTIEVENTDMGKSETAAPQPVKAEDSILNLSTTPKANDQTVEYIDSKDLTEPNASYVFSTVEAEDGSAKIFYFRDKDIIATEKLDANGIIISLDGVIPDRVFTEYYDTNKIKAVKYMLNGKPHGTVKAFYPNGALQILANFKNGQKEGKFSFYSDKGALLIEATYVNDKLNGEKKEYSPEGQLLATIYYKDDEQVPAPVNEDSSATAAANSVNANTNIANTPGVNTTADDVIQPDATVANKTVSDTPKEKKNISRKITVKTKKTARGNIYSLYYNTKYVGKTRLDKDYNVVMLDGKIPDGTAKVFSKKEVLEMELIFKDNEVVKVINYNADGTVKDSYNINEKREAIKTEQ